MGASIKIEINYIIKICNLTNMKIITRYIDAIKENIEFLIGENAQDNFDVIDASDPEDIWFHLTELPSCHIVAKIPFYDNYNRKQIHKIVVQGADICKQHSKFKSQKKVQVTYTKIKNVNKTHITGSVMLVEFSNICI